MRPQSCLAFALGMVAIALATSPGRAENITIINVAYSDGYKFINFDLPGSGTNAGAGTNINGISNTGTVTGFSIDNNGNLANFTANPPISTVANPLNINGSTAAMAFGVNSAGTVVGTDGNGNAFSLPNGGFVTTFIPNGGASAMAFGINDHGAIVGQYITASGQRLVFCSITARSPQSTPPMALERMSSTPRASITTDWLSASTSATTASSTASRPTPAPRLAAC